MTKMTKNQKKENFWTKTRPLQVAALVIAIAIGSVMIFTNVSATSNPPKSKNPAANASTGEKPANLVDVTDANFSQTIAEGVVLVDFWATWCPPCRIQNPILEQVALELGNTAKIAKLDVDHNPRTANNHRVQNIPTLIIFKDGQPVQRFVGVQQKETLLAAIQSHI